MSRGPHKTKIVTTSDAVVKNLLPSCGDVCLFVSERLFVTPARVSTLQSAQEQLLGVESICCT